MLPLARKGARKHPGKAPEAVRLAARILGLSGRPRTRAATDGPTNGVQLAEQSGVVFAIRFGRR